MIKIKIILFILFFPLLAFGDGLGNQIIDKTLTVLLTNSDAVDCDSVPTYEVYEDETGTAIQSGSMAKLNDAGTTGFYSEQLTLSAANGYEVGKSYSMIMECAVSSANRQVTDTWNMVVPERGTDNAFPASSAPANFSDLAITVSTGRVTVGTNNDKTGYSISGTKTTLDALNDISTANVNTEVSDVLKTDTISEMPQQTPPVTPTFQEAVMYLFMCLFNSEVTTTNSLWECKNSAGTVITKATLQDDGTTFTRGAKTTGP